MSWALIPARLIASRAARTANCEVYSPGAAFRRCLMPVRVVIHVHDFTAFVVAALRADAMLHTRLLTIRAQSSLRRTHRIVRPALAAARFRMTTFWIWHDYSTISDFRFVISDLRSRSPAQKRN